MPLLLPPTTELTSSFMETTFAVICPSSSCEIVEIGLPNSRVGAAVFQVRGHHLDACARESKAHSATQRPKGDRSPGCVRDARVGKWTAAWNLRQGANRQPRRDAVRLSGLLMAQLYMRQDPTRASVWNFIRARFARMVGNLGVRVWNKLAPAFLSSAVRWTPG
jgi:hypothetical protein